jgi:hypothetical protein
MLESYELRLVVQPLQPSLIFEGDALGQLNVGVPAHTKLDFKSFTFIPYSFMTSNVNTRLRYLPATETLA